MTITRKWGPLRHLPTPTRHEWTSRPPTWPHCSPLDVPARLQTGIIDTLKIERPWETPTRGRLRYREPENGKWRVMGAFEIEAHHPHRRHPTGARVFRGKRRHRQYVSRSTTGKPTATAAEAKAENDEEGDQDETLEDEFMIVLEGPTRCRHAMSVASPSAASPSWPSTLSSRSPRAARRCFALAEPGPVLLYAAEDARHIVRERLVGGHLCGRGHRVRCARAARDHGVEAPRRRARARARAVLVDGAAGRRGSSTCRRGRSRATVSRSASQSGS
jgi:hypothetical protein